MENAQSESYIAVKRQQEDKANDEQRAHLNRTKSDTNIIRVANITAHKNESNLFLIKSYSFIDKTQQTQNEKKKQMKSLHSPDLHKFHNIKSLVLDQTINGANIPPVKNPRKKKHKKMNTNNSDDDIDTTLLRHPSIILEHNVLGMSKVKTTNRDQRPKSMPAYVFNAMKRESFLRHSFQSIRRSFTSHRKSTEKKIAKTKATEKPITVCLESSQQNNAQSIENVSKKDSGVLVMLNFDIPISSNDYRSELDEGVSLSNLQLDILLEESDINKAVPTLQATEISSLTLQESPCLEAVSSNSSFHSQTLSRKSKISSDSNKTADSVKLPVSVAAENQHETENKEKGKDYKKEKEKKDISTSRAKKFQRYFSQVSKDEKLINYFSCALVGDILLQGHLYISQKHFAFYSNVFGYVTKVVIPTASVTKISKEKTVKIIPNALGITTTNERHVFSSFLSREAAYRLMCSVCLPALAKATTATDEIKRIAAVSTEICEEYSVEDDYSSCSLSGYESSQRLAAANFDTVDGVQSTLATDTKENDAKISQNQIDIPNVAKIAASATSASQNNSSSTTTTSSTSFKSSHLTSIPHDKSNVQRTISMFDHFKMTCTNAVLNLKYQKGNYIIYICGLFTLLLAMFTVFLLLRILDIESKTNSFLTSSELRWHNNDNDEFSFLKATNMIWPKKVDVKSSEETELILKNNLKEIIQVRRSLETLSLLIHDKSPAHLYLKSNKIND